MKITNRDNFKIQLLNYYGRDIDGMNDEELIAEGLATIEDVFSHLSEEEAFKRSRPLAVAYLALCIAEKLLYNK